MPEARTIRIFLASSSELAEDRKEFEIFINRKNKLLNKENIFIELDIWEDFLDAMSQTRLQDEYNRVIKECDIFVMLFFTKVGKYTREEFETAFGQFKVTNKPLIYTFFRKTLIKTGDLKQLDLESLWEFQDKLSELGHFWTEYQNIDYLKYQFSEQLEKLRVGGFAQLGWLPNLEADASRETATGSSDIPEQTSFGPASLTNIRQPMPCAAYNGKEPYIFISYGHADSGLVYAEIKALHELGYWIWYDEGIDPTDEWLKKIALAIDCAVLFVVLITRSAVQSRYVNKEVLYAIRKGKLLLPVYLEKVSLPSDWELGLGDIQAVEKY